MSNPQSDDHGGGVGVNPASVRTGHEPDTFAVKPILAVPLAVAVSFVIAFVVATAVFAYFVFGRTPDPMANPAAVKRDAAPLNKQFERIDRQGLATNVRPEVDQPRLEPNRTLENNGRAITQMPLGGVEAGNSPEIHPEDIRPDNVAALREYSRGSEPAFSHIPIDVAIELATKGKQKAWLPAAPVSGREDTSTRPSASSGGRGTTPK